MQKGTKFNEIRVGWEAPEDSASTTLPIRWKLNGHERGTDFTQNHIAIEVVGERDDVAVNSFISARWITKWNINILQLIKINVSLFYLLVQRYIKHFIILILFSPTQSNLIQILKLVQFKIIRCNKHTFIFSFIQHHANLNHFEKWPYDNIHS